MYRPDYLILRNIVSFEEVRYEFQQGKPVLVIGDNKDDPSQRGNGAGKSVLQDGISLALTGSPVRNISSTKKLVRRGHEFGEVEYMMSNAMFRSEIKIQRKIYSTGKSQEVKIYQDGEQIVLSDVNEYNKYIFEMLAISKEDFYNFYLITKDYYKPFLRVGDAVKKDIINRFSGADKIDGVDLAIDDDVKVWENKIQAIQRLVDINQGKQEIVSESITKLSVGSNVDLEVEEQRKAGINRLLSEKLESAENYNEALTQEELMLKEAKEQKDKFEPEDFDFAITLEKGTIEQIKRKNDERRLLIPKVKQEFAEDVRIVQNTEAQYIEGRDTDKHNLKETQQILTDLEAALAGTIHCPKCAHEFILADHDFDVEQGKKDVAEARDIIEELQTSLKGWEACFTQLAEQKEAINQKVALRSQEIRDEIAKDQDRINELQVKITDFEGKKREQQLKVNGMEDVIRKIERTIENYTNSQLKLIEEAEKLETELNKPQEDNTEAIESAEAILLSYIDEAEALSDSLGSAQQKLQEVKEWYGNFKSFKSFLANQSIRNVQDYTNLYLQQMGSNLSIEIEGYKKQSTGKIKEQINTIVCRDGLPEDEYGTYSGGERGRIDVACILAIQHLINLNSSSGGLDLLIADEIFDSIDALGLEHIFKGLLNTDRTVLFISQVQINTLKENTLVIRKENKVSRIFTE